VGNSESKAVGLKKIGGITLNSEYSWPSKMRVCPNSTKGPDDKHFAIDVQPALLSGPTLWREIIEFRIANHLIFHPMRQLFASIPVQEIIDCRHWSCIE
jgi:hypothetical protein